MNKIKQNETKEEMKIINKQIKYFNTKQIIKKTFSITTLLNKKSDIF